MSCTAVRTVTTVVDRDVHVWGLYDVVGVTRTVTLACGSPRRAGGGIAPPGENICVKALASMRERYGVDGVEIRLDKRVPFGAGLGSGSSDGAPYCWRSTGFSACGLPRRSWSPLPPSWVATRLFRAAAQLHREGRDVEPAALPGGNDRRCRETRRGRFDARGLRRGTSTCRGCPVTLRRPVVEWQDLVTNVSGHIFTGDITLSRPW